jgi:hypothetical protein
MTQALRGVLLTKSPTTNVKLVGTKGTSSPWFATYRAVGWTCPSTCPLLGSGCYAQSGPTALQQRERYGANDGKAFKAWILGLPQGAVVRLHVAGDVMVPNGPNGSQTVDVAYLEGLLEGARSRPDVMVYGYTHAWHLIDREAFAWPSNLILNASVDDPNDLDRARALGWDTTTVVPSNTAWRRQGNVVVCPNQTVGISCAECKLCLKPNRSLTVAFKAHGQSKRKVDARL